MASAHDVAAYILQRTGPIDAMKLQKLVYYAQAWHVVWEDQPLFAERIEAWAKGPVVPDLYRYHRGKLTVRAWPGGKAERLTADEASTVDAVVEYYGDRSGWWLSELTHRERPWCEARAGIEPGDPSVREISTESMALYYGSL